MKTYVTACGKPCGQAMVKLPSARFPSNGGSAFLGSLGVEQEWTDECGAYLVENHLAPGDSTHVHKGLFYKKGRSGNFCYWNGFDWVRSSKRESLLTEIRPYKRLIDNLAHRHS